MQHNQQKCSGVIWKTHWVVKIGHSSIIVSQGSIVIHDVIFEAVYYFPCITYHVTHQWSILCNINICDLFVTQVTSVKSNSYIFSWMDTNISFYCEHILLTEGYIKRRNNSGQMLEMPPADNSQVKATRNPEC